MWRNKIKSCFVTTFGIHVFQNVENSKDYPDVKALLKQQETLRDQQCGVETPIDWWDLAEQQLSLSAIIPLLSLSESTSRK